MASNRSCSKSLTCGAKESRILADVTDHTDTESLASRRVILRVACLSFISARQTVKPSVRRADFKQRSKRASRKGAKPAKEMQKDGWIISLLAFGETLCGFATLRETFFSFVAARRLRCVIRAYP